MAKRCLKAIAICKRRDDLNMELINLTNKNWKIKSPTGEVLTINKDNGFEIKQDIKIYFDSNSTDTMGIIHKCC